MPNRHPNTATPLSPLNRTALALTQLDLNLDLQRHRIASITETLAQIRQTLGILPLSPPTDPNANATPQPECPIHLGPIPPHQTRTLPCGHVFCHDCLARWLPHSPTCPLDRSDAFTGAPRRYDQQPQRHDSLHELEATPAAHPPSSRVAEIEIPPLPDVPLGSPGLLEAEEDAWRAGATDAGFLVERIAFHERLVDELRALQARATRVMGEGTEVGLNGRWREFLESEVEEHWVQARALQGCVEGLGLELVGEGRVDE